MQSQFVVRGVVQMIEDRVLVGIDHDTAVYNCVKAAVKGVNAAWQYVNLRG